MNEVRKALRPVRARIRRNRFLRGAAAGLAAGLSAAAAVQAVSFFVPIPDRWLWAAAIAAAAALLTAAGNALRPVKDVTAAEAADACGLEERAVTALETAGKQTEDGTSIYTLQHRDACEALGRLNVKQIRPGSVRKALLAALGCAVALGALLMIPSPQDRAAETRKALVRTLKEGRGTIEQAAAEDEEKLTPEERSELRKITADLDRELNDSRDAADALVALDRAEQRLEQMRKQTAGDAAAAADGRSGEGKDGSGEAGKSGNTDANPSASTQAQAGNGNRGEASEGVSATAAQMKTMQAISALKGSVNPSAQTAQAYMSGNGMQGTQSGTGGMPGAGPDNGKAGAGAGEGSTNEEQSGGGSNGGTHVIGNRDPKLKEMKYETIYDPERIARSTENVLTEQKRLGDEDAAQLETGPGRGSIDGNVPWGEALQEYADTEARSADRENLTVQERQWVEEYYRLLTEQN